MASDSLCCVSNSFEFGNIASDYSLVVVLIILLTFKNSASGSDAAVIQALAENYPESKTATDGRGRTPLHFALGDKPASPDIIFLLSSSGAAGFKDDIGMLVSRRWIFDMRLVRFK